MEGKQDTVIAFCTESTEAKADKTQDVNPNAYKGANATNKLEQLPYLAQWLPAEGWPRTQSIPL